MLIVVTSLPAADYSTFLLLQREKLDRQWFEARLVVRPMPRSTMNIGVVGQEVQRPAVGRQPSRSAQVHGGTGTLAELGRPVLTSESLFMYPRDRRHPITTVLTKRL